MLGYITLFLLVLQIHSQDLNLECVTCASKELKSRWFLTGLPRMSDGVFTDCRDVKGISSTESCNGPCFTMIFEDPDEQSNSLPLFVRGCHSSVMQVTTQRLPTGTSKYCEIDTAYKITNSKGSLTERKMLVEFCNGVSKCNDRNSFDSCSQPTIAGNNNALIPCYDCLASEGSNCKEGKCNKRYCMKQKVNFQGKYQVVKSCSNVNIFGIDSYCSSSNVFLTPGGLPMKTKYEQCFCKDKQFCNTSLSHNIIIVALIVTCLLYIKL